MNISDETTKGIVQVSSRRYSYIDVARGLAACLVLFQHTLEWSGIEMTEKGSVNMSLLNLGETGVLVFFFVSGFVIPLSLDKAKTSWAFWKNRAFRIYPLYMFVFLVTLMLTGGIIGIGNFVRILGIHLVFAQEVLNVRNYVGNSWTLALEALWYVGIWAAYRIASKRRVDWLVVFAVTGSWLAIVVSYWTRFAFPFGRIGLLDACVCGYLSYKYASGELSRLKCGIYSALILFVILVGLRLGFGEEIRSGMVHSASQTAWLRPSFLCVSVSWGIGALLYLMLLILRDTRAVHNILLVYLGKISYSIYLVNIPVVIVLGKLGFSGPWGGLFAIVATLGVSDITYRLVERPFISFSHRKVVRPS